MNLLKVLCLVLGVVAQAASAAQPPVVVQSRVLVQLDAAAGEYPDGVTVDRRGNLYYSLFSPTADIVMLPRHGNSRVVANVDPLGGGFGMVADAGDNVYVVVLSGDPSTHGVWVVQSSSGRTERIPGSDALFVPNGVAIDDQRNLYVTDSFGPLIGGASLWRVARDGVAEPWSSDPLLATEEDCGVGPVGADGIVFGDGRLLVTNFCAGTVVEIPIMPDGSAGPGKLFFDGRPHGVQSADGIAFDVRGNVFFIDLMGTKLWWISADGNSIGELANESHGLDQPASLAFGIGDSGNRIYVTNLPLFLPSIGQGPAVIELTLPKHVRGESTARPGPYPPNW